MDIKIALTLSFIGISLLMVYWIGKKEGGFDGKRVKLLVLVLSSILLAVSIFNLIII